VPTISKGARGRLDLHDGTGLRLDSGHSTGQVEQLKNQRGQIPRGFTSQNKTHVEAHAAAYLWLNPHIREATLYVNRPPCPGPNGCNERLPEMLPQGRKLTVYAPHGIAEVYHGQAERPSQP
jgi:hypothetical protein